VVRLEQAVDAGVVAQLRERLVARLARRRHVPQHAGLGYALKPSSLADLTKDRAFAEFWGARVVGALDELLGAGAWQEPAGAGQILSYS
jgi:hypothetical protein